MPGGRSAPRAANLRLKVAGMDEAGWLHYTATLHARPPMADFDVRAMSGVAPAAAPVAG